MILSYPGGPNVFTRVLIRKRRQEGQKRRCDEGSRGLSDTEP